GAGLVLLNDVGGEVHDVLVGELGIATLRRHRGLPGVVCLRLAPVGDDLAQEIEVEAVGYVWNFLDRVERRTDATLEADAMAARAVLSVEGGAAVGIARQARVRGRGIGEGGDSSKREDGRDRHRDQGRNL